MYSLLQILLSLIALTVNALPSPGFLQQITNFGPNPTNTGFYIYIPKKLSAKPALLVAIHYCTGTAQSYFKNTQYGNIAEKYGYIVIYPSSPHSGTCWDVSSKATLTHNGGGDSGAIVGMVKWTLENYPQVDSKKVFVSGESSGAMMTNVLAAAYPEIFSAAVVYAGVPAGCFQSTSNGINAWNSTCSQGKSLATPQKWASIAKTMSPGYTGPRPKMLIYHGAKDTTLSPHNYEETLKQWCGVFAYDFENPVERKADTPTARHVTTVWGPMVKGVLGADEPHSLRQFPEQDMEWFGLK